MPSRTFLGLDVGDKRVGIALGDSQVKIAVPFGYLERSDEIIVKLTEIILRHNVRTIVVGYPRNQSGEPTQQSAAVERFVEELADIDIQAEVVYQDESLTSVEAERRLGRVKDKGEIDAEAASIILQDYLEEKYAK
ncbi:Holliday junction resolvase RuvX [Candidatus Saccharibacteria bacterium 32-49-12]|nr:MAG: Holliday junction resolvase RuvX [Candidatus Saccharibacteria bacterium 32-49-12]